QASVFLSSYDIDFAALKAATRLLAWTRQVSLGWTKGSAFGIRQEPKAPGPRFAERRSRGTEPGKKGASARFHSQISQLPPHDGTGEAYGYERVRDLLRLINLQHRGHPVKDAGVVVVAVELLRPDAMGQDRD